jgi:hypothetical protein
MLPAGATGGTGDAPGGAAMKAGAEYAQPAPPPKNDAVIVPDPVADGPENVTAPRTVIETVAGAEVPFAFVAVYVKLAAPLKFVVGVNVTDVGPLATTLPLTAPEGVTLVAAPPVMKLARLITVGVLNGTVAVPAPAIGNCPATVTVTVAGAEVPPVLVAV